MAKLFGRFKGLSADFSTGKAIVSFEVENKAEAARVADDLNGYPLDITVCKHREKRSLDANAYLWVLIGKIADVLRKPKDEVYLDELKRHGQGCMVKVRAKNAETFAKSYKYIEPHEDVRQDGFQYFHIWVGSSDYNTEEMSILIDGVISDAKDLGIDTATPNEIDLMKEAWR